MQNTCSTAPTPAVASRASAPAYTRTYEERWGGRERERERRKRAREREEHERQESEREERIESEKREKEREMREKTYITRYTS